MRWSRAVSASSLPTRRLPGCSMQSRKRPFGSARSVTTALRRGWTKPNDSVWNNSKATCDWDCETDFKKTSIAQLGSVPCYGRPASGHCPSAKRYACAHQRTWLAWQPAYMRRARAVAGLRADWGRGLGLLRRRQQCCPLQSAIGPGKKLEAGVYRYSPGSSADECVVPTALARRLQRTPWARRHATSSRTQGPVTLGSTATPALARQTLRARRAHAGMLGCGCCDVFGCR
jgi:hypothetical protein